MSRKASIGIGLVIFLFVGLPLGRALIHLQTESWWFTSVGFESVFWKSLFWEGLIGAIIFSLFIIVLGSHYWLSLKLTSDRPFRLFEYTELARYSNVLVRSISQGLIGFIALAAALSSASSWSSVLEFLNSQPINQIDPIFSKDISFYLFRLPFWDACHQILLMLSIWSLALPATLYSLKGVFLPRTANLTKAIQTHLTLIGAAIIALMGWGFWLERYHLLTQSSGRVYGIGYTDANARLFGLSLMSVITILTVIVLFTAIQRFRQRLFLVTIFIFGSGWISLLGLYPWMVQQFIVSPNELVKEKPYLSYNIKGTQEAYQLEGIQAKDFDSNTNLNKTDLQNNKATLQNVRIWDSRPLLQTYGQLQEIRSYYRFSDIDIDRYNVDGQTQQVMLSARELDQEQLPQQAKNWVNQQLKFTHGHGLAMSPVNRVKRDGLPEFFVQDIPPQSTVGLEVNQPGIYYGELTHSYVFTGTTTDEFDYPQGQQNALVRYAGNSGVQLSNFWRKLAYANELGNLQILISNYFTPESRIHYHRNILKRAQHIAPFLRYDHDPYLVLSDGRLYWVIDAYSISDRYPYSEPSVASIPGAGIQPNRQINYIRNSVKVIIDAYSGELQFNVVDPNDSIIQTYQQIFPDLFIDQSQLKPPDIQAHFRYPEDLFKIQTNQYLKYHMSDPEVFYNGEDLWQLPIQKYEDQEIPVDPYYVIMRLPQQEETEFTLIQPFTPNKKDNMISWMAARSDGENYGSLIEYNFPKKRLVLGPRQIEAKIDQDPNISQQLTLWSQSGSKVIRGNLIVLPIENSLIYVEPIYLRADNAQLPQLKRVVVAYDDAVVMANTFEAAMNKIFSSAESNPSVSISPNKGEPATQSIEELAQEALETHEKAENAARIGDWARFGQLQKKLKTILQALSQSK